MNESYTNKTERDNTRESKELAKFIEEADYTAEEVREAYYRLFRVIEDGAPSERLQELQTRMETMIEGGYPLNRIATLIENFDAWEHAPKEFDNYVETLPLSDKEKQLLTAIVHENRKGVLGVAHEGETFAQIEIGSQSVPEGVALTLVQKMTKILAESEDKKISIWFEEK